MVCIPVSRSSMVVFSYGYSFLRYSYYIVVSLFLPSLVLFSYLFFILLINILPRSFALIDRTICPPMIFLIAIFSLPVFFWCIYMYHSQFRFFSTLLAFNVHTFLCVFMALSDYRMIQFVIYFFYIIPICSLFFEFSLMEIVFDRAQLRYFITLPQVMFCFLCRYSWWSIVFFFLYHFISCYLTGALYLCKHYHPLSRL